MTGHLATRSHTRCKMLLLDLQDGTSLGITDHDKDIDYDIGDGTVTYDAGTGILTSNVSLSCGLDADNYEVTGPLDVVTREGVIGGRYNRARARLFEVNWKNLSAEEIKILAGNVSEARVEGGKFIMEVRSDTDRLNQTVGRILQNQCDADYADQVKCFATPTEIAATVTAVTDAMRFTVSFSGTYANGFFDRGKVTFATGGNAGTKPVQIESWTALGAITLFMPLVEAPEVGNDLLVRDGCDRTRRGANGCMVHGQILNFRGFPEVPGSQALKPAVPAQGSNSGGKGK